MPRRPGRSVRSRDPVLARPALPRRATAASRPCCRCGPRGHTARVEARGLVPSRSHGAATVGRLGSSGSIARLCAHRQKGSHPDRRLVVLLKRRALIGRGPKPACRPGLEPYRSWFAPQIAIAPGLRQMTYEALKGSRPPDTPVLAPASPVCVVAHLGHCTQCTTLAAHGGTRRHPIFAATTDPPEPCIGHFRDPRVATRGDGDAARR